MTMKLTISNDDPARMATIEEETYEMGKPVATHVVKAYLNPGESREVYVHAAKRVIVSELP